MYSCVTPVRYSLYTYVHLAMRWESSTPLRQQRNETLPRPFDPLMAALRSILIGAGFLFVWKMVVREDNSVR